MKKTEKNYKEISLPNDVEKKIWANDEGDYLIKLSQTPITVGILKEIIKDLEDDRPVMVNGVYPKIYIPNCPYERSLSFEDEDCVEIENAIEEYDLIEVE